MQIINHTNYLAKTDKNDHTSLFVRWGYFFTLSVRSIIWNSFLHLILSKQLYLYTYTLNWAIIKNQKLYGKQFSKCHYN